MKILIVNTYDRGGAANACLRLHKGLRNMNIDSSVLLLDRKSEIPNSEIFIPSKRKTYRFLIKNKIKKILIAIRSLKPKRYDEKVFLKNRSEGLELFSFPHSNFDITESKLYQEADIINLHWVAGFLDYETFFKKNKKPVVWTLHDMNAFSGGEHYEESYIEINAEGLPVKRIYSSIEKTIANKNVEFKKRLIKKFPNLTIVAPSHWLANEARKSKVLEDKPIYHIPYGIDSTIFIMRNKDLSRELLGIPKGEKVILFVADSIENNRKGFKYLIHALEELSNQEVILCTIGNNSKAVSTLKNVIELGTLKDDVLMSHAYSAADVFVIPSIMDNLPNTCLESLLCGTPIIGFPVGGIIDMIQVGENGYLTKDISVTALKNTIQFFLEDPEVFNSSKISENAKRRYDLEVQAKAYIALFKKIIN